MVRHVAAGAFEAITVLLTRIEQQAGLQHASMLPHIFDQQYIISGLSARMWPPGLIEDTEEKELKGTWSRSASRRSISTLRRCAWQQRRLLAWTKMLDDIRLK